jgi:hypothetical protein
MLFRHDMVFAIPLALLNAGSNIEAKIDMIAITTNNSINVNINELYLIPLIFRPPVVP